MSDKLKNHSCVFFINIYLEVKKMTNSELYTKIKEKTNAPLLSAKMEMLSNVVRSDSVFTLIKIFKNSPYYFDDTVSLDDIINFKKEWTELYEKILNLKKSDNNSDDINRLTNELYDLEKKYTPLHTALMSAICNVNEYVDKIDENLLSSILYTICFEYAISGDYTHFLSCDIHHYRDNTYISTRFKCNLVNEFDHLHMIKLIKKVNKFLGNEYEFDNKYIKYTIIDGYFRLTIRIPDSVG